MPVWHEKTAAWRESGKLTVIGVAQEQHPDRCLLFARWKRLDWPILWDPFNMTGTRAVPRATLIDEHGVVRSLRPDPKTLESEFLDVAFDPPVASVKQLRGTGRELVEVLTATSGSDEQAYYRGLSSLLWPGSTSRGDAIDAVARYVERNPLDAAAVWRLGVAHLLRHDAADRQPGDFQAALDRCAAGLALEPRQYIYRRRIQQYGPRLDKPYPFYPWVAEAQAALRRRGEEPPPPIAPLTGAEIAGRGGLQADPADAKEPDPEGKLKAEASVLRTEAAVAWHTDRRHAGRARVHLRLRPAGGRQFEWDREAGPLQVWVRLPDGWRMAPRLLTQSVAPDPNRDEVALEFELECPDAARRHVLEAYALFYACLDDTGTCRYLRHDFRIGLPPRR